MFKNTKQSYGMISKLLHWLMAFLFIAMFIVAYTMINIPKSDFRFQLYDLHKATGLLLLMLFLLRLTWRFLNNNPISSTMSKWQHYCAMSVVIILYTLMCFMPITGTLTSTLGGHDISFYSLFVIPAFGQNKSASEFFSHWHEYLSYLLIAIFSLHLLASLYHHYVIKDNVLKRMWLFGKST